MVDLGGYVIILVETRDKKIKLYGSPADKADLEVGDEILEVNGRSMEEATHTEVISHIHQCIRSRTICLRVKRKSGNRLALDLAANSNVQDAFVIAVEQQARERLERLSALKRIKPVDMTKLSQQLNQIPSTDHEKEINGFIEKSPIYVTSINSDYGANVPLKPFDHNSSSAEDRLKPDGSQSQEGLEEPEVTSELELKQDLTDERTYEVFEQPRTSAGNSENHTPFANGRTEVLIGQDGNSVLRTTAVVENNRLLTEDPDVQLRSRRRSGSSIVVVDDEPLKHSTPEEQDEALNMMMTMLDNGPHRELPVDVPDSFIAINKTPPRYPPPRMQGPSPMNGSAKPVPPPRDHLRIEKDGRLMNRLPAPQVPARTITTINNNTHREPTKQEMDSIRKFEEQIRQRKEEEERIAKQNEFLKSSIRSSKKLQAVESNPPLSGVVNDAYSDEEFKEEPRPPVVHKFILYGELIAALQRLQHRLKESKVPELERQEPQLSRVQAVLLNPRFARALSIYNKVREVTLCNERLGCLPSPQTRKVQEMARDCIQILEPCSLPEAGELNQLLTTYEMEGLLSAHDMIASGELVALDSPPLDEVMPNTDAQFIPGQSAGIKIVNIDKTNEPLGATVRNEGEAVIIGRIIKGGAADKSGLLHEGDEVLQVNGIDMRGKTIHDVCDMLSGMVGTLTFLIIPGHTPRPIQSTNTNTVIHMKAHFDYDPEDDTYIPCKELGISFQKGDVLHVISQEDPNWWQAYREGEEDQVLAGLIPSRSFQHQRESLKQQIAGDKLSKEKNKKSSTLLCAKKHNKKKKKKGPYSAYSEGTYPIYSSTLDDYDADEILTYEEVSLYYPRANHKRPIVLIGPPNIGRHELRQRLMEDSERFAAAIPHTSRARKESEVDGQDYHFTSRAQFEADILARKFVEHGEYEKAYYGTSLDAIRTVVGSGKICVLNLHPQSLKILRSSDLKPYVVFVAPPSLEKLRQKKIRNAEAYKEDELKGIIEKAREMEDKYGHFFDMIIINNDTERTYLQLLKEINSLEREPQWVPASWVKSV